MPAPLSTDLRKRVLAAYQESNASYATIAARFKISADSVRRYISKFKEKGTVAPEPHGGGMPAVIGINDVDALADVIAVKPDATLNQMVSTFKKRHNIKVTRTALHRALVRFGITSKKKAF